MKLMNRVGFVLALVTLGLSAAAPSAHATHPSGDTGLGVILGEPTGFSLKHWTDANHALDGGLAYSFGNSFQIFGDYLWHDHGLFGNSTPFTARLSAYIGAGLGMGFATDSGSSNRKKDGSKEDFKAWIRVPFGAEWILPQAPVGLGVELVPGMKFVEETEFVFQGGFLVRYYF